MPLVTKSSISTPIYASDLSNIKGSLLSTFLAAFIPAIIPCAAASSYPEDPFTCPAKKSPSIPLYSRLKFKFVESIQSYSIA